MQLKFEDSQNILDTEVFLKELRRFQHIILFGAGRSGSYFLNILRDHQLESACFCDNYCKKQGIYKEGHEVLSFEEAIGRYPQAAICITSVYSHEIYRQILQYNNKLENQIFLVMNTMNWETDQFMTTSGEENWIQNNYAKLEETYNMLEDETSKSVLEGILNFRLTRNFNYIKSIVSLQNTYFDDEMFPPEERAQYKNYVDCGTFTGDSVQAYLKFVNGIGYDSIYCFEPDNDARSVLEEYISQNRLKNINVFSEAIWSQKDTIFFDMSGGGGSSAKSKAMGVSEIKTVALDELEMGTVDYIKLDVEGAEFEALVGMKKCIQKQAPVLAVSVYYKQDDLIRLPQLIKEMEPEYKLYLRQYMYVPYETVLYAIKRGK